MKILRFFAIAMLFALAGTSIVEATKGCGAKLNPKDCKKKHGCEWRHKKCRSKVSKPGKPGVLNNMIENPIPLHFFDKQGGTEIASTLTKATLPANPGADGDQSVNFSVAVPKNATYLVAGAESDAGEGLISNQGSIASLGGLSENKTYQITVDSNYNLVAQECSTSTCL